MSDTFWLRSVSEDRDLSRAASERYLMLQALSARSGSGEAIEPSPAAGLVLAGPSIACGTEGPAGSAEREMAGRDRLVERSRSRAAGGSSRARGPRRPPGRRAPSLWRRLRAGLVGATTPPARPTTAPRTGGRASGSTARAPTRRCGQHRGAGPGEAEAARGSRRQVPALRCRSRTRPSGRGTGRAAARPARPAPRRRARPTACANSASVGTKFTSSGTAANRSALMASSADRAGSVR